MIRDQAYSYRLIRYVLIVAAAGFLCPINALALNPNKPLNQYNISFWNNENGLPLKGVVTQLQTRDGYIWLATSDGLVRFNGVQFTLFNRKNTRGINNNAIYALAQTRDGTLWIGTGEGLTSYSHGVFFTYTTQQGLPNTAISSLYENNDGTLWIGTFGAGVCSFKNGNFTQYNKKEGLLNGLVTSIHGAGDGSLWIGTYEGLFWFKEGKFVQYRDPAITDDYVTAMHVKRDGSLLVGKQTRLFSFYQGAFTEIKPVGTSRFTYLVCIYEDYRGTIWISDSDGIARLHSGQYEYYSLKDAGVDKGAGSIMGDREGDLWIATSSGIARLTDSKIVSLSNRNGLYMDQPRMILSARDGSLLVQAGPSLCRLRNGVITQSDDQTLEKECLTLKNTYISSTYEARDGAIWITTHSGVRRYSHGKLESYTTKDGLPTNITWSIAETADGQIWVACNGGLAKFQDNKFSAVTEIDNIQIEYPSFLLGSHNGGIWVVLLTRLCLLKDGHLTQYGANDRLNAAGVNAIYEDSDQALWIARDNGVDHFKNGHLTHYGASEGLIEDELYTIAESDGYLWFGSKNGILRVNKQDLNDYTDGKSKAIHNALYGVADGMLSAECISTRNSVAKTSDGRLWFITLKGLAVVDPANLKINNLPPVVEIEQVAADKSAVPATGYFELAPGAKELDFSYSALSFMAPEAVKFKYRLTGYDKDWVDGGSQRVAQYMNLPPGKYRFTVIACNNDGVWNESGAYVDFYLKPHFYQTYLFYALCGLVILMSGAGAYQLRIRQLKAREKELAKRVEDALAEVKVLSGLLPICSGCKKIRDDRGDWSQIESYIHQHSQADFSHGICPDCIKNLYPEYADIMGEDGPS